MAGPAADESPAAGQPAAVQAAFESLRQRFIAGLPQRWAEIEAAPDAAARQQALHRLAGAAGSYGCTALGGAARAAEQAMGAEPAALDAALSQLLKMMRRVPPHSDTVR